LAKAARCTLVLALGSMLVGLAVLAAGCGGGGSPGGHVGDLGTTAPRGTAVSGRESALAFSRCMRSHGVQTFPDPTSGGAIPKVALRQLGVSDSLLQTAESACRRLLPNGGGPTRAALQQSWSDDRTFAHCMRSHGVPSWPDPTRYPLHPERPTFDLQAVGIDPTSPQISTTIHACEPLLRGNNPQHLGEGGA
jgi:hypothetical protein